MRNFLINIARMMLPNGRMKKKLRAMRRPNAEKLNRRAIDAVSGAVWGAADKTIREAAKNQGAENRNARLLMKKSALLAGGDTMEMPDGARFWLPQFGWDFIQTHLGDTERFYEQDVLDGLRRFIPKGAVILDIGANIGNHSIFWARDGASRIHAFEPVPRTFAHLVRNIGLNDLGEIIIPHNIGLGDAKSAGAIAQYSSGNIGGTHIAAGAGGLKIEALDGLDLGEKKIDFVKIDVEGFELKTLAGAKKTLERHRPAVFIEAFEETADQVAAFFAQLGYGEPKEYKNWNWLFLPDRDR
ncbi:MAG: FkbM family methyltransferase [Rickettsiales bacterium]|jgi:FkbM family methyltransferase|nr:FkbM family methyltransferase [Rickettsiales bacterium]